MFTSKAATGAFGCNLNFIGNDEFEFARLIFGQDDSPKFPGKKELVGFWYDADNRYTDSEMSQGPRDKGRKLKTPIIEHV